jgi:CRP-like cAMP-binding protein
MTDFLSEKKREIQARLKELRPLVDEYHRLEAASQALEGVAQGGASPGGGSTSGGRARRGRGSRGAGAGAGATTTGKRRRGRPKGSGTRANQALELVRGNPGITIPEIAEKMGIKQNYLYRVLPGLEADGLVRKEGRGWHAKAAA